ncbi:MAG: hypothetical protein M1838_004588 [Thelocarpon superellum]|nr:MAG: hypothetical protein M1838_004588 [Thelocarpon superellum]
MQNGLQFPQAQDPAIPPPNIRDLVNSMTPEQLQALDPNGVMTAYIMSIAPTLSTENGEAARMPPPAVHADTKSRDTKKKGTKKSAAGKPMSKPRFVVPPPRNPSKKVRPLNSWIAYRSYYGSMFSTFQQKDISAFLTFLWKNDPFKAKWAILAKAYSVIRDSQGKHQAPLDFFLAINAPFIGIVQPAEYIAMLGWRFDIDEHGDRKLRRAFIPEADAFDNGDVTAVCSVHDVIQNSFEEGYIPAVGAESLLFGAEIANQNMLITNPLQSGLPALGDAFVAGPTAATLSQSSMALPQLVQPPQAATVTTGSHLDSDNNDPSSHHGSTSIHSAISPVIASLLDAPVNELADIRESFEQDVEELRAKVEEENRKQKESEPGYTVLEQFAKSGSDYPYLDHFVPHSSDENFGMIFDPFEGDPFDTYDINGYTSHWNFVNLNEEADS